MIITNKLKPHNFYFLRYWQMFIEIHLAMFEGTMWTHMFTLDETVFWLEKILRPIIIYFFLIILLRIFGRRELSQLNPIDLVVILSLSNTVQNAIIGEDNSLIGGVIGAVALLGINYLLAFLKFKNTGIETVVEGKPITLIENGKVNQKAIASELLSTDDLDVIANNEGYESVEELKTCVLNPNGSFLVEGKDEIKNEKFKRDVLKKLEHLSKQLADLQPKKT